MGDVCVVIHLMALLSCPEVFMIFPYSDYVGSREVLALQQHSSFFVFERGRGLSSFREATWLPHYPYSQLSRLSVGNIMRSSVN